MNNDHLHNIKQGSIEVICGPMFSGKSEELIRRLNRSIIGKQNVLIFKPKIDTRYSNNEIVSHNNRKLVSIPIENSEDIIRILNNDSQIRYDVIGIDEVQFFDDNIVNVCNNLSDSGIRVIVSGLDMNFKREPFKIMSILLSISEHVTKLSAVCTMCGNSANYSYRLVNDDNNVLLGERDKYEALCRHCFNKKIS